MGGAGARRLLLAVLVAAAAAAASCADAAAVVVGQAKCADCVRKNANSEAAFKGLHVAIKCKNVDGEYESKAVGDLDNSGEFSVPVASQLRGADCFAQLHSAAGTPCPGQEPSKIVPLLADQEDDDDADTFVAVAGETRYSSPECASVTICHPIKKKHHHHLHKKPVPPKPAEPKPVGPKPKPPLPEPKPEPPKPQPAPPCGSPSSPTPIYHPPAQH